VARRAVAPAAIYFLENPRSETGDRSMDTTKFDTIDAYIAAQPESVRDVLRQTRKTIAKAAPGATETISYGIPTFVLGRNLVHFGANKTHLGFYPSPSGIEAFTAELAGYKTSKGAVQFPFDQPVPYDLIEKITRYRVAEETARKKPQAR
jgi:uncharacterized protein YdhG (YjbR/CyaY superfamily)